MQMHVRALTNLVFRTGAIPNALRRVYIAPLPKPGKDPRNAESIRPITLISTAVKLVEIVAYHRMLPVIEPCLIPEQYDHRRERGTEMCLEELMDFVHREIWSGRGRY